MNQVWIQLVAECYPDQSLQVVGHSRVLLEKQNKTILNCIDREKTDRETGTKLTASSLYQTTMDDPG